MVFRGLCGVRWQQGELDGEISVTMRSPCPPVALGSAMRYHPPVPWSPSRHRRCFIQSLHSDLLPVHFWPLSWTLFFFPPTPRCFYQYLLFFLLTVCFLLSLPRTCRFFPMRKVPTWFARCLEASTLLVSPHCGSNWIIHKSIEDWNISFLNHVWDFVY